jgi:hypothetical protein
MAALEMQVMAKLGWTGRGLIELVSGRDGTETVSGGIGSDECPKGFRKHPNPAVSSSDAGSLGVLGAIFGTSNGAKGLDEGGANDQGIAKPGTHSTRTPGPTTRSRFGSRTRVGQPRDIKLVALDMDGTLLDSRSQVSRSAPSCLSSLQVSCHNAL